VQGEQEEPEFVAAAENQHHAVAFLDTLFYKKICSTLRGERQILERKDMGFVIVVTPHESFTLGLRLGVLIYNVVCKIEVVWNRYLEIFVQVFVGVVIYF
jgi:hypothetical protein